VPQKKRPQTGHLPKLDKRLAKALSHPVRTEIIAILTDRCASPRELADILGEELSKVSYHTKELLKFDCIEVVHRERVRGAVKTTYRATTRMLLDHEDWDRLSKDTRTGISINAVNELIRRASDAVEQGTFDNRKSRIIATLKMDVDEQAWRDANAAVRTAFDRLAEIQEEAANRKADGAKTFRMTASLLTYESPTKDDQETASDGA
jgi:DNA-binding transcriptional ArsR family regulator